MRTINIVRNYVNSTVKIDSILINVPASDGFVL